MTYGPAHEILVHIAFGFKLSKPMLTKSKFETSFTSILCVCHQGRLCCEPSLIADAISTKIVCTQAHILFIAAVVQKKTTS